MPKHHNPITVKGVIRRDNLILLVHQRESKYWSFPGGKQNNGESTKQTLEREVQEELGGLTLAQASYFRTIPAPTPKRPHHTIAIYQCSIPPKVNVRPSGEVDNIQWAANLNEYRLSSAAQEIARTMGYRFAPSPMSQKR